jgi:hypothetical protein
MKSKFVNGLVAGLVAVGALALSTGAQAGWGDTREEKDYTKPTDDYKPPAKPEAPVNEYKNCIFFDKIHFTYPVRYGRKGFYKKDFDVIVDSKFGGYTDLTGAVAAKLDGLCKGKYPSSGSECPFKDVDETKIEIKGVDLAVSCK